MSITVCLVLMLVVNVSHCPYHCLPPCPHCPAGFQHLFKRTPNIKGRQELKEYKPSTISYTGLCVYSPSSRCLGRRTRSWCTHRGLPLKLKGLAHQAPNIQHRLGKGGPGWNGRSERSQTPGDRCLGPLLGAPGEEMWPKSWVRLDLLAGAPLREETQRQGRGEKCAKSS